MTEERRPAHGAWTLHDGCYGDLVDSESPPPSGFGIEDQELQLNPHNRALVAVLKELKAAESAPNAKTIGGRGRIMVARRAADSVKALHRKWYTEVRAR